MAWQIKGLADYPHDLSLMPRTPAKVEGRTLAKVEGKNWLPKAVP